MVKQGKKETEAKIKGQVFVSTEEGSATWKSLDGEGLTAKYEKGPTEYTQGFRGAPWSREPSLKFMCNEVGVNEDQLIQGISQNKSDKEMAEEMGVPERTIQGLRKRFMTHGIASIEGQD